MEDQNKIGLGIILLFITLLFGGYLLAEKVELDNDIEAATSIANQIESYGNDASEAWENIADYKAKVETYNLFLILISIVLILEVLFIMSSRKPETK